ncbi:MAG TPA: hypothetical protein VKA44_09055, partial [Gemmatimonadota bacterium]|nr:hypothetical protein [Gemmatimonadota bacterium]
MLDLSQRGRGLDVTRAPASIWELLVDGTALAGARRRCREALARGEASLDARLVATSPGGDRVVLRRGRLPVVHYSVDRTVERILHEVATWPALAVRAWAETGSPLAPEGEALQVSETSRAEPPPAAPLLPVRLLGVRFARGLRTLVRPDRWNIGLVRRDPADFVDGGLAPDVRWAAEPPAGTFRADPFGLVRDGRLFVLFEELDRSVGPGRIVAEEWDEEGRVLERRVALSSDVHLSYPYLLTHGG